MSATASDLIAVRSRISFSSIIAGALCALAIYVLLSLVGTAVGISVAGNTSAEELGTAAAIWALASTGIALFFGGWVTTRVAVGEDRVEAVLHGFLLWSVLLALMVWLTVGGMRLGFTALLGVASIPTEETSSATVLDEGLLSSAGISDAQIERLQERVQEIGAAATETEHVRAAWWTLGAILLSLLTAVLGALAGSGPPLILRRHRVRVSAVESTLH